MKYRGGGRLGLILVVAMGAWTSIMAQQSSGLDVSAYPADAQRQYKVFAEKCSRCHDLSRPLAAKYVTEAQWRAVVERMARLPGANISRRDRETVVSFMVFHKRQSGAASTQTATAAPAASRAGDIASYPPEMQRHYKLFAEKCSRCHDLNRAVTARYSGPDQWRDLVVRMARRPGAGINRRDVNQITTFLVFHEKAKSGQPASPGVDSGTPATGAPGPGEPAEPASRTGVTEGGLRVEGQLLAARAIAAPAEGGWTTESPAEGENALLVVRLTVPATGEKVPYATVRARIGDSEKELWPLFGAKGLYYGRNFEVPEGTVAVSVQVEPPRLGRVHDEEQPWTGPVSVTLNLTRGR